MLDSHTRTLIIHAHTHAQTNPKLSSNLDAASIGDELCTCSVSVGPEWCQPRLHVTGGRGHDSIGDLRSADTSQVTPIAHEDSQRRRRCQPTLSLGRLRLAAVLYPCDRHNRQAEGGGYMVCLHGDWPNSSCVKTWVRVADAHIEAYTQMVGRATISGRTSSPGAEGAPALDGAHELHSTRTFKCIGKAHQVDSGLGVGLCLGSSGGWTDQQVGYRGCLGERGRDWSGPGAGSRAEWSRYRARMKRAG